MRPEHEMFPEHIDAAEQDYYCSECGVIAEPPGQGGTCETTGRCEECCTMPMQSYQTTFHLTLEHAIAFHDGRKDAVIPSRILNAHLDFELAFRANVLIKAALEALEDLTLTMGDANPVHLGPGPMRALLRIVETSPVGWSEWQIAWSDAHPPRCWKCFGRGGPEEGIRCDACDGTGLPYDAPVKNTRFRVYRR